MSQLLQYLLLFLSSLAYTNALYRKELRRSLHKDSVIAAATGTADLVSVQLPPNDKYFGYKHLLGLGAGIAVPIKIGNQTFKLVVDTGSSDTWVVSDDYQCADASNQTVSKSTCNFGSGYQLPGTFKNIPDENFFITYASTNFAFGKTGTDDVHLAGFKVPNQRINIAERVFFPAVPEVSGLLGLAYPSLTSAYFGNKPSNDTPANQDEYDPVFTTLYKTHKNIFAYFTVNIERGSTGGAGGGSIAFGGLTPHTHHKPRFVNTDILQRDIIPGRPKGETELSEYTIQPDAYVYGPKSNSTSTTTAFPHRRDNSRTVVQADYPTIIDTATSLSFVPAAVADAVNALFDPPAVYDSDAQVYFAACNASVPRFGVVISGHTFMMRNDLDYIIPAGGGKCFTAISKDLRAFGSQRKINLLGIAWLVNVLAVFDVGNQEMRFAAKH